jgi:hypothetical protein
MIKTAFLTFALVTATATSASATGLAFVSSTGSGTECFQLTPCSSMSTAVGVAGDGGGVICLDKGFYGGANITVGVTISCGDGLWEGASGTVVINTPAGADVVIEGLNLDGVRVVGTAVNFSGQGSLHLHRVRLGNYQLASSHAVLFAPTGPATLHISDSVLYHSGGSGVHIRPTGSGFANVHVRNVKFERNANGLFVDGSASTVGINVDITQSVFAENLGNGIGAFSTSGAAGISVSVKDAQITGNIGNGLAVLAAAPSGAGSATIEVGGSLISGNVTGVSASGAGQIRTFGNNQLRLNGNNGTFTGSVGLQ